MRHHGAKEFRPNAAPLAAADLRTLALVPEPAATERSASERLRALLAVTPHMFWSCDLGTGEDYYSPQWTEFTGVEKIGAPDGAGWSELVHPDDRERALLAWQRSLDSGAPYEHEHRLRHRGGSYHWVRCAAMPERDAAGRILAWYGSCTDVHQAVVAKEALRESQSKFHRIMDAMPHIVWSMAAGEKRPDYYNKRWYEFTGLPEQSLEGEEWEGLFCAEDVGATEAWRRSRESGEPFQAEYRLRHHSGEYHWVESRGRAERGADGEILRWYGTCTDIHQRVLAREAAQASERRAQQILDAVPHVIWTADPEGHVDYLSDQWRHFFPTSEDLASKERWFELINSDDIEKVSAAWRHSMATGEPFEAEMRIRTDAGERWIVSHGVAQRDAEGRILRWYGTFSDIHERVLALQALDASERRAQAVLDAVPHVVWAADADGRIDFLSNQWRRYFASSDDLAADERWLQTIHPDDAERVAIAWARSIASGEPFEAEMRIRVQDGDRWILSRGVPEKDEEGRTLRWYGTCTDIHQRVLAQQALDASERLNREMIEASPDCVSLLDLDGVVLLANEATQRLYGKSQEELIGRNWASRFTTHAKEAESALRRARRGEVGRLTVHRGAPDTTRDRWWDILVAPVRGTDGKPQRLVVMSRDITDQKIAEEKAQWGANHDCLTGLANRYLLQREVDETIAHSAKDGTKFALLLLDIDEFKRVNDTAGHDAGDTLLCTFAERLRDVLGEDGVIGRLGGDEFAALLPAAGGVAEVEATVQRLLDRLVEPCVHGGRILDCGASIGASLFPRDGIRRSDLMKNADMALYAAKAAGRGTWRVYEGEMRMEVQRQASMLRLASDALKKGTVRPYYQPKVGLKSGGVVGFEALMRWKHPRLGIQEPASIAAAFEDLSLAAEISDRMIEAVIADILHWRGEDIPFGHVAVNAAAAEFRRGDFAERLLERLAKAKLPTSCFQLEVTESVFVGRGAEHVERALRMLAVEGVAIALDDFGTGFASLSHLKHFPVDIVKIDRSFVCGLEDDPGDAAIVDAVTSLGRRLRKTIVAEGIETPHQHKLLQALGCDQGQGYYYGRPAPASRVPRIAEGVAPDRPRSARRA
jgi:diguanylate cyclase (GGDEF)-like protein/PAS domain S-box-containing protein